MQNIELVAPIWNQEAEEALLGAALSNDNVVDRVIDIVQSSDFYKIANAQIWDVILKLHDAGVTPDTVTVAHSIPDNIGNADRNYIYALAELCPAISNAQYYAKLIRDASIKRAVLKAGNEILELPYSDDPVEEIVDKAESIIYELSQEKKEDTEHVFDVAVNIVEDAKNKVPPPLFYTDFPSLDYHTGGLHEGNLVVCGARPGIGKTALALAIALNVAREKSVMFFSLEMSTKELVERALCSLAHVNLTNVRERNLSSDDNSRLADALGNIIDLKLEIHDNTECTMMNLRSKVRKNPPKLVVVDYLQLMTLGNKSESRTVEVATISKKLKGLSKEFGCCVLALSQLNRESEQYGGDSKPKLAQLRESGAIEQDADQVWLLSWQKDNRDFITIDIAKNRNGPIGEVDLIWSPQYTRFDDPMKV